MIYTNKEYKIVREPKCGTTAKNNPYTILVISDATKTQSNATGWERQYYNIYINQCVNTFVGQKIVLNKISAVKYSSREYNGKTYNDCTIYCNAGDFTLSETTPEEAVNNNPWNTDELPF